MNRSYCAVLVLLFALFAPWPLEADDPTPIAPPLFEGMGTFSRKVATENDQAQRYFDQGLILAYSYNHDEAVRSYQAALLHDPNLAMAWWGIAHAYGPHYNKPGMAPQHVAVVREAMNAARQLAREAGDVDAALIEALSKRYTDDPKTPRRPFDESYAEAMRSLATKYPNDADVLALAAEAIMQLRPWDLWKQDGEPHPGTPEALELLEQALRIDPNHPGANHLYVHAIEGSPHAELGLPSADRLVTIVPNAGHMIHMPAHIYARTGQWERAAEQNRRAIDADIEYLKIAPKQGFYKLYIAANFQSLAFACMMTGRRDEAMAAANRMATVFPPDYAKAHAALPFVDGLLAMPMMVQVRFGMWKDILDQPEPPDHLPVSRAYRLFARGSAQAALGDPDGAEAELEAFREACKSIAPHQSVGLNRASSLMGIAENVLVAEIAFRRGEIDKAVEYLQKAASIEDALIFGNPPDWMVPVRHTLGAVLLMSNRLEEAEMAYRTDLKEWPDNAWSLLGLAQALEARSAPEADDALAKAKGSWEDADIAPTVTCLCVANVPTNN